MIMAGSAPPGIKKNHHSFIWELGQEPLSESNENIIDLFLYNTSDSGFNFKLKIMHSILYKHTNYLRDRHCYFCCNSSIWDDRNKFLTQKHAP